MKPRHLLIVIIVLVPGFLFAQPGDPGVDPDTPITGIEFLLGGGALLGIRTFYSRFKSKQK